MPCRVIPFKHEERVRAIDERLAQLRQVACKFCLANGRGRHPATKLCDAIVEVGLTGPIRTCDAPICDQHATRIEPGLDVCPVHKLNRSTTNHGGRYGA